MPRLSELPDYSQQEANTDLPNALARRLGAAVVQDILGDYEAGATAVELAGRYGVSRTGITNLLHSQGAAVRSPRGLSPTGVDVAESLYTSGWLLREIGVELRVQPGCRAPSVAATGSRHAQWLRLGKPLPAS